MKNRRTQLEEKTRVEAEKECTLKIKSRASAQINFAIEKMAHLQERFLAHREFLEQLRKFEGNSSMTTKSAIALVQLITHIRAAEQLNLEINQRLDCIHWGGHPDDITFESSPSKLH